MSHCCGAVRSLFWSRVSGQVLTWTQPAVLVFQLRVTGFFIILYFFDFSFFSFDVLFSFAVVPFFGLAILDHMSLVSAFKALIIVTSFSDDFQGYSSGLGLGRPVLGLVVTISLIGVRVAIEISPCE